MNFIFWGLMLLMLLLAISLVIYPLLRVRGLSSIAYKESNLSLHEEKLIELDADLAENRIDQEHYRIARQELDHELLDNIPEESKSTAAEHYAMRMIRRPAMALSIAVFVPAFSMLLYMQIGMHAANQQASTAPQAQQLAQQQQQQVPSVEEMTLKLEQFVQQNDAGVKEWSMLGRAYKHLRRYDEAAQAFTRAIELQPNARLMLEKAEALALSNNQVFNDEARDLVMRASALEPDNINALWFAGVAEFQHANYRESIEHLSRLSSIAQEDADVNKSIRFYIDKARAELIARGEDVPEVAVLLQADAGSSAPVQPTATASAALKVNVSVSDEAREKFSPGDVVFVYAKAAQGPKMPLAVQRLSLAALPTSVTLDDSMAMIDGMNLSAFPSVIVAARISRSGSAIAQSGDYIGEYPVNDVNSAKDVISINIDRVVP